MMVKHLPFNEFDMCAVTNTVNRYKGAGLWADYDIDQKAAGVIGIALENPRNGSLALFEVHKLARPGWLGKRAMWVVHLWSQPPGSTVGETQGWVTGKTQAHALMKAEVHLRTCTMLQSA